MILIDPRVGSTKKEDASVRLRRYIRKLYQRGIKAIPADPQLDFGDFCFTGNGPDGKVAVGVELKTLDDIVSSIQSGRYAGHQLEGMCNTYDSIYLFVYGFWRESGDGALEQYRGDRWRRVGHNGRFFLAKSFNSFITVLEMAGVKYRRCSSEDDVLSQIAAIHDSYQKPWDDHTTLSAFRVDGQPAASIQKPMLVRRWAKELDGVGWKRARCVQNHFASAYHMAAAPLTEWQSVAGITPKLGEKIYKQIRRIEGRQC